jgi:hypothetical protein
MDAPLPNAGRWNLARIADLSLGNQTCLARQAERTDSLLLFLDLPNSRLRSDVGGAAEEVLGKALKLQADLRQFRGRFDPFYSVGVPKNLKM